MSAEQNKKVVQRFYKDLFEKGDLAVAREIVSPNYISHDASAPPPGWPRGIDGALGPVQLYRAAFPDVHFTIDNQLAEGDKVVTHWTAHGTHRGPLMGTPPTGRPVTISGISIDRIENGKMVETWINYDLLGLLQQIGVVQAMRAP